MEQQPNVSPEEQAAYDSFMDVALQVIYGDAFNEIFERLRADADPIEALAQTAVEIVRRVVASASENGQQMNGDVVFHAGIAIVEELADRMGDLGIHDFTEDELEKVTYRALDLYRDVEIENGELDQEGAQADWANLQEANRSGELDALMQDMTAMSGGKAPAAMQQQPQPSQQPNDGTAGGLVR